MGRLRGLAGAISAYCAGSETGAGLETVSTAGQYGANKKKPPTASMMSSMATKRLAPEVSAGLTDGDGMSSTITQLSIGNNVPEPRAVAPDVRAALGGESFDGGVERNPCRELRGERQKAERPRKGHNRGRS